MLEITFLVSLMVSTDRSDVMVLKNTFYTLGSLFSFLSLDWGQKKHCERAHTTRAPCDTKQSTRSQKPRKQHTIQFYEQEDKKTFFWFYENKNSDQMILCSPCATEGMNSNPLWEAKGSGNFGSGYRSRLILEVTCHWKIVVFSNLKYFLKVESWKFMKLFKYSNLKVIGVHPVDWSLPVTSRFDNHPKRWNTVFQESTPNLPILTLQPCKCRSLTDLRRPIALPLSSRGPCLAELSTFLVS